MDSGLHLHLVLLQDWRFCFPHFLCSDGNVFCSKLTSSSHLCATITFEYIICSLMPIRRKQGIAIWLWCIKSVRHCEITNPAQSIAIHCHVSCVFGLHCTWGFSNRKLDSESSGAYQQWSNCFRADSHKFYLHGFCLLCGLDACLDLLVMLLASKLTYKRSLPLPFFTSGSAVVWRCSLFSVCKILILDCI